MESGRDTHTPGNLMLLSLVLAQPFPLVEKLKPVLLCGVRSGNLSHSSSFREIFSLFIQEWNLANINFPEGQMLQAF